MKRLNILLFAVCCISASFAQESKVVAKYFIAEAEKAYENKNYTAAMESYKKAAEINPIDATVWYNMAFICEKKLPQNKDNTEFAIQYYRMYANLVPEEKAETDLKISELNKILNTFDAKVESSDQGKKSTPVSKEEQANRAKKAETSDNEKEMSVSQKIKEAFLKIKIKKKPVKAEKISPIPSSLATTGENMKTAGIVLASVGSCMLAAGLPLLIIGGSNHFNQVWHPGHWEYDYNYSRYYVQGYYEREWDYSSENLRTAGISLLTIGTAMTMVSIPLFVIEKKIKTETGKSSAMLYFNVNSNGAKLSLNF